MEENEESPRTVDKKPVQPVFNSEGKMIFSRFDFSHIGQPKNFGKMKGVKDPLKALEKLNEQKEKISDMKKAGRVEKVMMITEKQAWRNALQKAQGAKVKDDPELLKKSVEKKKYQRKHSKKKWDDRQENILKMKEKKQKRRQQNIQKKKKENKKLKMKKYIKKGRVIPGLT